MLVEIEAVQMSIPELQEVVIKTLFGDANVFGCLLERDSLLGVHAAPLGDFNHDFAYDALFFTARAQSLAGLIAALDESVGVLGGCFRSQLEPNLMRAFSQPSDLTCFIVLLQLKESKVQYIRS